MRLFDLFLVGALVHFCVLGLYLVRYIERIENQQGEK